MAIDENTALTGNLGAPLKNQFISSLGGKHFGGERMSTLRSFALLGVDIKITPEGDLKVIEVNGVESGMKGFQKAGVTAEETARAISRGNALPVTLEGLLNVPPGFTYENPAYTAVRMHIKGMGQFGTAIVQKILHSRCIWDDKFYSDIHADILNRILDSYPLVQAVASAKYREKGEKLVAVEQILANKIQIDRHFEDCRDIKERTCYCTFTAEERFRSEHARYVIVKPIDGRCGDSLQIIDLEQEKMPWDPTMVAERFVPSKPLLSSYDNQMHDGCMRYILFAEEDEKEIINLYHFGGYWRLCPEPMTAGMKLDAVRANLAKGAFAEKASEEDLDLAAKVLGEKIPIFYKDMIASVNKNAPTGI